MTNEPPEWVRLWLVDLIIRILRTGFFTWLGYQLFDVELQRVRSGQPLDVYLFAGSLLLMGFLPADLVTFVIRRFFGGSIASGGNGNGGK